MTSEGQRALSLHSEWIHIHLTLDGQLHIGELMDRQRNRSLLSAAAAFCVIEVDGAHGQIGALETLPTGEQQIAWSGLPGETTAHLFISLDAASLRWRLEMAGVDRTARISFPFLAALRVGDDSQAPDQVLSEPSSFLDGAGRPIFRHADWCLPAARIGADGRALTLLVQQPIASDHVSVEELDQPSGLVAKLARERQTVFQAELVLHDEGWRAAFHLLRTRARAQFDLTEYARPDLAWYQDQMVQHFTFLYGREILNLETGQFELDRFLDEGEAFFGGYDGFLIWGVYPRIGVDQRTQWDFYDDFPGGRPALRAMARRARERGARFFIPYKPWDRTADWREEGVIAKAMDAYGKTGDVAPDLQAAALHAVALQDSERLAQLVQDVEADGVFLDTMSAIGGEFRAAIDRVRPGVVFCSEGRAKGPAFEVITGSWDQSPNRDGAQGNWSASEERMPGVDLWRFIFPEHRLFVISRHSVGDDRLRIIQRGFFNGMGWVVWQDIFGLVLTYSPEEAALQRKCAAILRQHRQALWSPRPTPLVATARQGVYANEFPAETKRLWTFYNETTSWVDDPIIQVVPRPGYHFVDVWNNQEAVVDDNGYLSAKLAPRSVGAVAELPRRIILAAAQQRLSVVDAPQDASLWLWPQGAGAPVTLDARSVPLERVHELVRAPCLARLLMNGELIDQIVIDPQAGDAQ